MVGAFLHARLNMTKIKNDNTGNPRKGPLDAKCLAHQQGAISLLKLRQDPCHMAQINRSVDRSVRRQIVSILSFLLNLD